MWDWLNVVVTNGIFKDITVGHAIIRLLAFHFIFGIFTMTIDSCIKEKGGKVASICSDMLVCILTIEFVTVMLTLNFVIFMP